MKQKKEVLKKQELVEVKGGDDPDRQYCPEYGTCRYSNPMCYYQQLPGGYILPCLLA